MCTAIYFGGGCVSDTARDKKFGNYEFVHSHLLRDELVAAIRIEVTHCDHFSPCETWPDHKKAKRVDNLWDSMKIPWGLPECEETKKWFNETARSRWSDFKTRKLKPYFDFAKGDLVKAKANCPKFIDPPTWEKLCDHFSKINDTGIDMSGKSKSQKCKDARKANKMNHCLGRTSLIKWKDKHIDELGKPPNVAQTFDKAYLRIDPLEHHGSSNSNQDVESDPWTGITNNPEVRRVSEELHKFYEKAIVEGNEETNANTQSLLNVFGRSTRLLGHVSSRSNNERSKRASSSNKGEIEMLREKVAEAEKKRKGEKRKRKELESKIGVLMACMQNHGMLPLDDNHSASNSHHTESSEDENIDK